MENDLSHGDIMFSMVFTKESITKALNNLKIGKAPGIVNVSSILEKTLLTFEVRVIPL
jgi:hypothetical protein